MLGIEENNEPIDIEHLVAALRGHLRLYPGRSQFYALHMPEVYDEMIEYYKAHPSEFIEDFTTVNGRTIELTKQQKKYLHDINIQFKKK